MKLEQENFSNADVLHIDGRIDASSAPVLQKEITSLIEESDGSIVLDLADVDYVSSAGLRVFLMAVKVLANESRGFALAALNADVMDVVNLTGFHQVLTVRDTVEDALQAIAADPDSGTG